VLGTSVDAMSNLDFLMDKLNDFKSSLQNDDISVLPKIKAAFRNFLRNINPNLNIDTGNDKTAKLTIQKLQESARGYEGFDKALRENRYNTNEEMLELIEIRKQHLSNMQNAWDNISEKEKEITETLDLSYKLLYLISSTFTAAHLSQEQFHELQEKSKAVIDDVMKSDFVKNALENVKTAFAEYLTSVPWIKSSLHILQLLAPYATTLGDIVHITAPFAFLTTIINLSIVALHYAIRLNIFFWRKYAKKRDFNINEFLNDLKARTPENLRGGARKRRNNVSASRKLHKPKRTMKGAGFLPPLPVKTHIEQVHTQMAQSLPPIQGVRLPMIQRQSMDTKVANKQINDDVDVNVLNNIVETIMYDVSQYSQATRNSYKLTDREVSYMASALNMLVTSDTVDIHEVYGKTQFGGKVKRISRLSKKTSSLSSRTKKELITHAKAKGLNIKSTYTKKDIVQAIIKKK
jgi:hypothetical protein